MTLIKNTHCLWQTAEQYRYDATRETIKRWIVYVAIVGGFVALPIVGYVLWGKL